MDYEIFENVLHVVLFSELVIGILLWIYWASRNKSGWKYALAPVLFFCHAMLYLILTLTNIVDGELMQVWADLVSIHGVTLLVCWIYIEINSLNLKLPKEN